MTETTRLAVGDAAPDFTAPDAEGQEFSLGDFAGSKLVIYFYPRASTPGCTTQACDFRDNLASLEQHGYKVIGISPDKAAALKKFASEQSLTFPLLSDPEHSVAEAYGAWGEKKNYGKVSVGLIRSTIVVDESGTVEAAQYNVRAKGHVAKLRRDLGIDD